MSDVFYKRLQFSASGTLPYTMGVKICPICQLEKKTQGFAQHENACRKRHAEILRDLAYQTRHTTEAGKPPTSSGLGWPRSDIDFGSHKFFRYNANTTRDRNG